MYYGIDSLYIILVLPAIFFSLWAQSQVSSTFARYSKVSSYKGLTGMQTARQILDENGLSDVRVDRISGNLTDHYDPKSRVIRLSDNVYGSSSIAAIGVAAHEAGHALQHANSYAPLVLRNTIIPLTSFGSKLSFPLILLGFLFNNDMLIQFGIIAFALVTFFQLVTLPVEFNASGRAIKTIESYGILQGEEIDGTKKVLTAAALTYLAALIVSAMQLLRLVLIANRRRR